MVAKHREWRAQEERKAGRTGVMEAAFADAVDGRCEGWSTLCVTWSCLCAWGLICRRNFKNRLDVAHRQNRDLTLMQAKDTSSEGPSRKTSSVGPSPLSAKANVLSSTLAKAFC